MAIPDFFQRNAVAASQVLAGFDEERIRSIVEGTCVGVTLGSDARTPEGFATLDLLTRLLSRLYPSIAFRGSDDAALERAGDLARRINPTVDLSGDPQVELVIGKPSTKTSLPRVFVGSSGGDGFVSTKEECPVGGTHNSFGPGIAACLGAANLFRYVFLRDAPQLDTSAKLSAFTNVSNSDPSLLRNVEMDLLLFGDGAIGNAACWALGRLPVAGLVRHVDPERIDLGNLQRYVLAERSDVGEWKTDTLHHSFSGSVSSQGHHVTLAQFLNDNGHEWNFCLLALDSARDRRAAQASLPRWIANAWTQAGDLGVSTHDFVRGACVACLYLPQDQEQNEDVIIATALCIPERLMDVRVLLHRGSGVGRELLEAIATASGLELARLLPFEDRPLRELYVEGFCGGAVLPIGAAGTPRRDVHVPLAHQSALAGILLAAAGVEATLINAREGTWIRRVDVLRSLQDVIAQPAAKDPRGICICQDPDYRAAYSTKYLHSIDRVAN